MTNFPCTCGHLEIVHPPNKNYRTLGELGIYPYAVCDGCFLKNRVNGIQQLGTVDCKEYKADNLLYLEQLSEKS